MLRLLLLAMLLPACTAGVAAGAAITTGAAVSLSAVQRNAGGCYAVCTGGTTCNPRNGLCERMPCDGRCGAEEHCVTSFSESTCVAGAPSDVVSGAPGSQKTIPILQPVAMPSGPPQIIPAAELNPPSHK